MPLPNPKPWATNLKTYWSISIPPAVNGVIPQWSAMAQTVIDGYNAGKAVVYFDGSQAYYLMAVVGNDLRFYGRFAASYPNANSATLYYRTIDLSSGAVTNHTIRLNQTAFT